jgi:hypothetical protein
MKNANLLSFCLLGVILTGFPAEASAQTPGSNAECRFDGNTDVTKGKPVIFGDDFHVSELHLRFVNKETRRPIIPKAVHINYGWKWLEYPYPEHAWGAWSDASESVLCSTGGASELLVPARTVKPRGWYEGKYTRFPYILTGSKKPKFDGIVIVVEFDNCTPRLEVEAKDLDRYKDTTAVIKLPCQWPVEVEFVKRSK